MECIDIVLFVENFTLMYICVITKLFQKKKITQNPRVLNEIMKGFFKIFNTQK